MKTTLLLLLMLFSLNGLAIAEDPIPDSPAAVAESVVGQSYFITLSEYKFLDPVPTAKTDVEIVRLIEERKLEPVETIRLSAIAESESSVAFGKMVYVTVGTTGNDRDRRNNKTSFDTGTVLTITAAPRDHGVLLKIQYTSSRVLQATDESQPEISSIKLTSSPVLSLNEPTLLASTSSSGSSYLVVNVSESPLRGITK